MTSESAIDLATLRFEGERFKTHALDVRCAQELVAYRMLVLECAKELWRRRHPDRVRLPKNFEEGFRVEFDRVLRGSVTVPLRRVRDAVQSELAFDDEFDAAATLIDDAISAADRNDLLPEGLPASVVPLFRELGATLGDDEALFVRSRGSASEAFYSLEARTRLADWVSPAYEDAVDLVGEVRMANVGPGAFRLQLPEGGALVEGRYETAHEASVLEALKGHHSVQLRVVGIGEFQTRDRQLRRITKVDRVESVPKSVTALDDRATPIWRELAEIGRSAPAEVWAVLPDDLSMRIDEAAYGAGDVRL